MSLRKKVLGNDKGLGDTIERFTKLTGIKNIVDKLSEFTGKDCQCKKRKDKLNRLFSYNKLKVEEKQMVDNMIRQYREGYTVPIFLSTPPVVKRLDEEKNV
tara:strand:+ start:624 stop:926 length:303 start_codon:yes stop_codon:yes gene_type:complete